MDQLINIKVSIPQEAMGKLVKTASETFEKLIHPLTSATPSLHLMEATGRMTYINIKLADFLVFLPVAFKVNPFDIDNIMK